MPIYLYETIPSLPDQPTERFEVKQSMNETALSRHPKTGEAVRRIISGGFLILKGDEASASASKPPSSTSCGSACACHP